ncbi:MAG: F0F1 ATP synthase subunit B' [Pseudomonadota bacterium]
MASGTEGAESAGMPQLDFTTFPNQIFWLVVALVAIYFILNRVALPRIASVLAERRGTIQRDLDQAEEMKQKAVEAEEAYAKALADARSVASEIVAETKAEIAKEIEAATAKADAEIAAKAAEAEKAIAEIRDNAAGSVETVAKDTAADLVAAIIGTKPEKKTITAAVDGVLKG